MANNIPFTPSALPFASIQAGGRNIINAADHDAIVTDLSALDVILGNITGTAQVSDALAGTSSVLIMTPYTVSVATQLACFLQAFNG